MSTVINTRMIFKYVPELPWLDRFSALMQTNRVFFTLLSFSVVVSYAFVAATRLPTLAALILTALNTAISFGFFKLPEYIRRDSAGASILIDKALVPRFRQMLYWSGLHYLMQFPLFWIVSYTMTMGYFAGTVAVCGVLITIDLIVFYHCAQTIEKFKRAKQLWSVRR